MCRPAVTLLSLPSGSTLTGGTATTGATGTITLSGSSIAGNIVKLNRYNYTVLGTDSLESICTALANMFVNDADCTASATGSVISLTAKTIGIAGNNLTLTTSVEVGSATPSDSTSSRWRIDPYSNSKIELREVGMDAELTAMLPVGKYFKWKPYGMPSPAQIAQLQSMGLPYQAASMAEEGTEFVYYSISDFRFGCNDYTQSWLQNQYCIDGLQLH
jgi:hypothetical protein